MWITKRTDYATRAVLALALVDPDTPVKLGELARRTAVPRSVLEQVMPALRSAGIVRSEHGARGGYRLNKPPGEITLEQVVRIFQGQLAPIACATRRNPEPCPMGIECSLRFIWQDVRDATITVLSKTTFASLADRAGGAWRDWERIEH
jgi:Rrf2 family protein